MKHFLFILVCITLLCSNLNAQKNILEENFRDNLERDQITRSYVTPVKIIWQSDNQDVYVRNSEVLLSKFEGQLSTSGEGVCVLRSDKDKQASVLLDFGKELHGGLEIAAAIRGEKKPIKVRIRLGESASEAMSDCIDNTVPGMASATNDHSLRDYTLEIPWLGTIETGNSGFRFVRIDLLDKDVDLPLKAVRAIFRYRDIPYAGSFKCSDERLNKIWETGAYTVHLNMQEYLWDGIKRDRLVWLGDIHPEVMTINSVFSNTEVIKKSLDFGRDTTPIPGWMNGMSSYSLWWIITHRDYYIHHGNKTYLKEQQGYLNKLIDQVLAKIDSKGKEQLDGGRFLDWPTDRNPDAIHAGLQALMVIALEAAQDIAQWLDDGALQKRCAEGVISLRKYKPKTPNNKQAAALLSLANIISNDKAANIIMKGGANDFATFYGYYMLEALAKSEKHTEAMEIISDYWGAMLDLGATTFWENFDYDERLKALPIDQLPNHSQFNIHADGGDHCYIGLRGSLCHGWAAGPTAWLTAHVLGIQIVEPGAKTIRICPNLGNLTFAEGTFPTPYGTIKVKHTKQADGKVKSELDVPLEIRVLE